MLADLFMHTNKLGGSIDTEVPKKLLLHDKRRLFPCGVKQLNCRVEFFGRD